jgi:outer membrane lipoprotein SlyB
MARERLSRFNVVATYPDMAAARRAFDALEAAGVDGDDMSLLGRHADEVAAETETRERDAHLVGDVSDKTLKGGAIGSVAGAVAGAAAFVIPGIGPGIGVGIWAATLGGAIAGGAIGGVAGGVGAMDQSEDWELTYDDVAEGKVLVATHADAKAEAEKHESVLKAHDPEKIERFDESGKRIEG